MTRIAQDVKAIALVFALFALLVPAFRKAARHRTAPPREGLALPPAVDVAAADDSPAARAKPVATLSSRNTYRVDRQLIFPVQGFDTAAVISYFGDERGHGGHQGVDIKAPRWTPVVATTDGFIERLREGGNAGLSVYLRAADGKQYFYAHLEEYAVAEMDAVRAGDVLGYVGDSGNARRTTPHLHFEIMVGKRESVDPLPYLSEAAVLP
jgi:murein DD-endopeptidase MepM/ murein hydrolase activator NlpD